MKYSNLIPLLLAPFVVAQSLATVLFGMLFVFAVAADPEGFDCTPSRAAVQRAGPEITAGDLQFATFGYVEPVADEPEQRVAVCYQFDDTDCTPCRDAIVAQVQPGP